MLTPKEQLELRGLEAQIRRNEDDHRRLVLRREALKRKELGQAYRFQNSHEAT